jgi:hypothetical protein
MALSKRDFVVQDLLILFRSRCAKPELIKDESTDARHYCGYDQNLPGWRLLSDTISLQPHIHAYGYWLRPTDMDGLGTIGEITDKLMESRRRGPLLNPKARTGPAGFLAVSERTDNSSE